MNRTVRGVNLILRMAKKSYRMILITVPPDGGDQTARTTVRQTGQDTNKCHQLLGRGSSFPLSLLLVVPIGTAGILGPICIIE